MSFFNHLKQIETISQKATDNTLLTPLKKKSKYSPNFNTGHKNQNYSEIRIYSIKINIHKKTLISPTQNRHRLFDSRE
jgi:hypothetical protein